jgi:dienelactone hydrolase
VWQTFHVKQLLLTLMLGVGMVAIPAVAAPEKVEFNSLEESRPGGPTKLTGYLFKPEHLNPKKPVNAIVLAHGCSGMLDGKGNIRVGIAAWADRFVAKGWVALAVDSFNPRGEKEVCTKKDRPILESRERPRDAYGALAYLVAQPYVKKDGVFLLGFSNGATGTLYAAEMGGKPLKMAKAANISFRGALAFYPGCTSAVKRNLKPAIPLGIFIGELDDWTPAAPCKLLAKNAGANAKIHLYPNAYHGFDVPGAEVRIRKDVRMKANPQLAEGVHVGGNDEARAAAIKDVDIFIDRVLKKVSSSQGK